MTAGRAMSEQPVRTTPADDRVSRHRAQPVLRTSADGPISGRSRSPERGNEQPVLIGRTGTR
jgi:hypothetical protein